MLPPLPVAEHTLPYMLAAQAKPLHLGDLAEVARRRGLTEAPSSSSLLLRRRYSSSYHQANHNSIANQVDGMLRSQREAVAELTCTLRRVLAVTERKRCTSALVRYL